ncbi:hypothetical protein [Parvimonas micra]
MANEASVSVFFGENILIIPELRSEFGFWVAQYQDEIYSLTMSNTELGKEILSKLEYKDSSKGKNSKKDFWTVTGIKSYNTFSKKYKLVGISKYNDKIKVELWVYSGKGYSGSENPNDTVELTLPINPEMFGEIVRNLALNSKDIDFENEFKYGGFETADDSKISYNLLPDEYIDIEDGHTDAYQIYIHEEYENNYIGFMIDSGYEKVINSVIEKLCEKLFYNTLNKKIKKTWTRWYGPLKSYEYKDINNKMYYAKIFGKTDKVEKQSFLFKDGEEVLELTFEIDLANTPLDLQEKIRKDFIELVESVKVNKI